MSQLPAKFASASISRELLSTIQKSITRARAPTGVLSASAPISDNAKSMEVGVAQTKQVGPQSHMVADNKARIGMFKGWTRDETAILADNFGYYDSCQAMYQQRIVRIYQPDIRVMQNTPRLARGERWAIEFEPRGVYKSPYMGWGRATQDMYYRHKITAMDLDSLVNLAKMMGWGYEIDYPKERWTIRKSYGDNFKWRGVHKPDLSDDFE